MSELADLLKRTGFIQPCEAPSVPTFKNWSVRGGIYVDDKRFCIDVLGNCHFFDCITYTATAHIVDILPVRKMLTNRLQGIVQRQNVDIRYSRNIHTKLYLINNFDNEDEGEVEIWLGSMNLVSPGSWHNLMIKANDEQTKSLKLYFNKLWESQKNQHAIINGT